MEEAYRTLGELLGEPARANECADYIKAALEDVKAKADEIPAAERLRVIYAVGENGTEVYGKGSLHAEVLELIGAENVADIERYNSKGRAELSMEQIIQWNPEAVLLGGEADLRDIMGDPAWANISAVQTGRIYQIPSGPYNWLDQPPSVQRVLGLKWLAETLYPGIFGYDMAAEAQRFYRLFWHYELTEAEARAILDGTA